MDHSGMTVNERLAVSGLVKEFDLAKKHKDRQKLIDLLQKVKVDENSMQEILKGVGLL